MHKLILVVAAYLAFGVSSNSEKKIVCYYAPWAAYRPDDGKYDISNINPNLCTHLIYSFIGLSADGSVRILDPELDITKNGFARFNDLRKQNPSLKTLISMGGWNEGSVNYSRVVSDETLRTFFVKNVIEFVKKYDFNGFDLDWEYPAQRNGLPSDKDNFVKLLKELKENFEKESLILSVATGASENTAKISYNIKEISKYVDFINLMTYDFHGTFDEDKKVNHNAPLYAASNETDADKKLNINYVVNYWLSEGALPEKLILGTAFYGKSFTLQNRNRAGRGAPFARSGKAGIYTGENGTLGYYEVCDFIKNKNWQVIYDKEQRVPYAYSEDQIVGFDDPKSLKKKAEFVKKFNLGGAMVWSIDMDDFNGKCGKKNPLLTTLNKILRTTSLKKDS